MTGTETSTPASHVFEVAEIAVTNPVAFENAVAQAQPDFLSAKGCHGLALHRVIELPTTYRLTVTWEMVDHHMVLFRQSAGFQRWRDLVSPWFAAPPVVTHSAPVALGQAVD